MLWLILLKYHLGCYVNVEWISVGKKLEDVADQERDGGGLDSHNCKCEDSVIKKNLSLFSDFPITHFSFHFFLVLVFY